MKAKPAAAHAQPLSREDLDYYIHLLCLGWEANGLAGCADAIRAQLDRFDRTRLPSTPGNTGAIPWQRSGTPRGKQRMGEGVSRTTGKAQEAQEYGVQRFKDALGR